MKKLIALLFLSALSVPAFAQTTTTNTTTSNTAVDGSTNVIVSTPNGTIGNQVNSPANSNNVYVVNGQNSGNGNVPEDYRGRYRDDLDREDLIQRRNSREYEAARQSHDYRDRPNYYNIRGNQERQFNERNRSDNSRSNYQSRSRRTSR